MLLVMVGGIYMNDKNTNSEEKNLIIPSVYTVGEIAQILNIGKNAAYNLIKTNQFKYIRIGRSIRIVGKSFEDWLKNQ